MPHSTEASDCGEVSLFGDCSSNNTRHSKKRMLNETTRSIAVLASGRRGGTKPGQLCGPGRRTRCRGRTAPATAKKHQRNRGHREKAHSGANDERRRHANEKKREVRTGPSTEHAVTQKPGRSIRLKAEQILQCVSHNQTRSSHVQKIAIRNRDVRFRS